MLHTKHHGLFVYVIGQGDAYHRHLRVRYDFLHIGTPYGTAVICCKLPGGFFAAGVDGHYLVTAALSVYRFGIEAADKAAPEHSYFLHEAIIKFQ